MATYSAEYIFFFVPVILEVNLSPESDSLTVMASVRHAQAQVLNLGPELVVLPGETVPTCWRRQVTGDGLSGVTPSPDTETEVHPV